ncbi:RNA polymerase sigma factor [Metabacillus idriensis]|uniref:RNA polymerase sigma factor n=1 Tax=Metabacillus idriensis TaxID=324768 RepID=UPI00174B8616|nr:RNA polymerase sigma factor [Metabacillus idriensis]
MNNDTEKGLAVSTLYIMYSDSIFHFIDGIISDYHTAEDLTQETFMKAYKSYDFFNHQSSARTWLYKIARNISIDYIRKQKIIFTSLQVNDIYEKEYIKSTETIIESKETSFELYQAIEKLKDTYKKVIVLRKVMGYSIKEVSYILGWSENKVKLTLLRALKMLKKELLNSWSRVIVHK